MATSDELKEQLEKAADRLASDPNASVDALRFLFLWQRHAAAMAEERAASIEAEPTRVRPSYVPRAKAPKPFDLVKARVLDAATEVLRANPGYPMKTGAIFDQLPEELASQIPGNEPKGNLSAMMHNSKRFRSHGRSGWTLPDDPGQQTALIADNEEGEDYRAEG